MAKIRIRIQKINRWGHAGFMWFNLKWRKFRVHKEKDLAIFEEEGTLEECNESIKKMEKYLFDKNLIKAYNLGALSVTWEIIKT